MRDVVELPEPLSLPRHRDLAGRNREPWARRLVLTVLAAVSALGLFNVFGQRPATLRAETPQATISVYAPTAIRGGDFMEARFHITAKQRLRNATLVLDPGWAEGISVNTVEPSPVSETSDNGRLVFGLGPIRAGRSFILFMQFQINATNLAWHRPQNVELRDGATVLARIHRTITVFP